MGLLPISADMPLAPDVLSAPTKLLGRFSIFLIGLTLFAVVYAILRYRGTRRHIVAKHGCQPPPRYPSKDPIFGLDFVLKNVRTFRNHVYLQELLNRYRDLGTTYSVRVFYRRGIITCDPENIKTILSTRFKDYSLGNRTAIMGPLLGKGIFVNDGEEWSHSRSLLRPNFVRDQVADLGMLEDHLKNLLPLVPRDGTTVDLQELFLRFTIDSATEFLFGHSLHTLTQGTERDRRFGEAFAYALDDMALQFRLGPWRALRRANPQAPRAYETCRAYVDGFVDEAIAYRDNKRGEDAGNQQRYYFLRELAKATDDRDKIRDELLNILIAGRDTTASLLSSLFHVLARRPDVWQKVRQEVTQQLQGRIPSYDELRNSVPYARHCISETLRLYPPVPNNTRLAVRDTVLPRGGGPRGDAPVFVPKGCTLIYTVYAMHRRVDLFGADADEFRPERWETQRYSWEYLPFNGGPRICLGQQYAMTEALYVLIRFAQEFTTIEARDPTPWTELLTLTVLSAKGVQVALQRA
ncbi:cytochrome P450 [Aspergillus thermomutatus]|uniref:Cytochrome P450 n=1 Tax=Aspergillus thermomutatus TaxID=41047 RepID=A0A397HJQ2_ASPTH|nr:uncharacterized protein CDV56_108500 [Aspergillus thermomutatus]RHZ63239.1 hypothetical protein CDV56_108500 [Aspergillus thermomutatus]